MSLPPILQRLRIPVIGSPMFIVSNPKLVIAQCTSGIVGAFPEEYNKDEGEILYEEIEARIKEEAQLDLDITRVDWFSTYKVHSRHVEEFSSGRCFLAGDSAHIHTPAGGQGMNTGIQDAYNLAWKMALVLKGFANERILETYNEERLPNARRLLQTTDRMFNLAAGTDWLLNLIRTTIFPPMAKFILSLDAPVEEGGDTALGDLIARAGTPDEVRVDPAVVKAYLGEAA